MAGSLGPKLALPLMGLALWAAAPALAQEWPYAVRIEGARMHRHLVTLPDGTTLVPLMRLVPAEKDTYYWYRLESLLTTPERWPIHCRQCGHQLPSWRSPAASSQSSGTA